MRDSYPESGLQEQALRELTLGELTTIETVLQAEQQDDVWSGIIHEERQTRDKQMEIFAKRPVIERNEEHSYSGAESFFQQVRSQNLQRPLTADEMLQFPVHRQTLRNSTFTLLHEMPDDVKDALGGPTRAQDFVRNNLEQIVLAPLVHGLRPYNADRNAILTRTVPGRILEGREGRSRIFTVDRGQVTGEHIAEAHAKIQELKCTAAPLDFFQLLPSQKEEVYMAFLEDVNQFVRLVKRFGLDEQLFNPRRASQRKGHVPFAFLSYTYDLQAAIRDYPQADIGVLCSAFTETPRRFQEVARIHGESQRIVARRRTQEESPEKVAQREREAYLASLSPNDREMVKLIEDPDVKEDVLQLEPGATFAITGPGPESFMPGSKFEKIVDKYLELIGRARYASLGIPPSKGVGLHENWGSDRKNVGALMRKKTLGGFQNVQIRWEPVGAEELKDHFKNRYSPDKHNEETVTKLVVSSDIKNSGVAGVLPVSIEVMLLTQRLGANKRDKIEKSPASRVEGEDAVESRQWDIEARYNKQFKRHHRRPHLQQPIGYGAHSQGLNRSR